MGIDFGFTEESRKESGYTKCRPYLRRVVAIWDDPSFHTQDPYAPGRLHERVLNARRLHEELPDLYDQLQQKRWPRDDAEFWYWSPAGVGDAYNDKGVARALKPYLELRPSGVVLLAKLSAEQSSQALEAAAPDQRISAWDKLGYERRMAVCHDCPVRPLDEATCYLRFSNYPGMSTFRIGFLVTAAYAETITRERLADSPFAFPHLNRSADELPIDKIRELCDQLEGIHTNKEPEQNANRVLEMVRSLAGPGEEVQGKEVDLTYIPMVDEFISKYVYRDEPYSSSDARELLPYLETLQEASDWGIWETDSWTRRQPMISFRNRISSMIEGLKVAEKYDLQMYVSY